MEISLKNKKSILLWLIGIAYSGLFFPFRISNVAMILLIVYCVFSIHPREILSTVRKNPLIMLIVALFFIQVIGLLYTSNLDYGLFVIEKKIWLLAIPLLAAPAIQRHREDRESILRLIGILSMLSSVVLLGIAVYRYYLLNIPHAFDYVTGNEYEGFTSIHYVYYSMYFACGSLFLIDGLFDQVIRKKYGLLVLGFLFAYSLGIIFLAASKMAIAAYGVAAIVFLYFRLRNKRLFVSSIALLAILTSIFFYFNGATRSRFEGLDRDLAILNQEVLPEEIEFTGLNVRLLFWKLNIQHEWNDGLLLTGTGTGDAQDYIDSIYNLPQYKLYGYVGWDPHNQWVYSLVQLGIIGVLSLAYLYFSSFRSAIKQKDLKFFSFLIITLFFSMTESILELNKGIIFFSLIFTLFSSAYTDRENLKHSGV